MPFRDIVGHRAVVQLIARAVARDSLPPSGIFEGPDGVGKRQVAVALAQALNCVAPIVPPESTGAASGHLAVDACGTCAACRRISRGLYADVLVLVPAESGSITIAEVRSVVDQAGYRPFEGRRRVVIVDEADRLVVQAQNALLKTLEEPPPASLFVLVTARPDTLLPTVRSRCPRLRFGRLAPRDVARVLVRAHGYTEEAAHAAAGAADGSVSRALEVASGEFSEARDAAATLLRLAATDDPRQRLDGAKALLGPRGAGRGAVASEREQIALRLRALGALIRDIGLLVDRAGEGLLANADLLPALESLARAYDSDRVIRAFTAVDRALGAVERNASPKIVADWVAFQL